MEWAWVDSLYILENLQTLLHSTPEPIVAIISAIVPGPFHHRTHYLNVFKHLDENAQSLQIDLKAGVSWWKPSRKPKNSAHMNQTSIDLNLSRDTFQYCRLRFSLSERVLVFVWDFLRNRWKKSLHSEEHMMFHMNPSQSHLATQEPLDTGTSAPWYSASSRWA